jgi:hypothetical protein
MFPGRSGRSRPLTGSDLSISAVKTERGPEGPLQFDRQSEIFAKPAAQAA